MRNSRRRVVITGLGIVAPNGIGKEAFWENLVAGKSAIDYITAFDPSAFPSQIAGEVRDFHPSDFVSARKAKMMGRFAQFAVAAARLALEDAALSITPTLSQRTTIYNGTSVQGEGDIGGEAHSAFLKDGVDGIKPWAVLEYPPHTASSYIAIEFGIKGPAVTISSNCCTSIDAIQAGYADIVSGRADVAVVGGCDAPIFPVTFAGFCALGALSKRNDDPKRASRPYDLLRDGAVIAEGAGTLVLEEWDSARDRGARIYAEVFGSGGASEAVGVRKGDLSGRTLAAAISRAIYNAGLQPTDIDHINAHGSSLPDYDVCDSNAFKEAFGQHAYHIPISSIKSMIGQPVAAAGAVQTAAACLSIRHQIVPPTINYDVPDPQCDLDYVPNFSRIARVRHVLVNTHSFGGSVAALVIGKVGSY